LRSLIPISLGKLRRLQCCATATGRFVVLAADHRQNLRHDLQPNGPERLDYALFADFKRAVAKALSPRASAILVDPEFGLGGSVRAGALAPRTGLIVSLEETGYGGARQDRLSKLLVGWTVEKAVRIGADAVKLLVYYHPQAPNARAQRDLVRQVADVCQRLEIPLFLETLSFSPNEGSILSSSQKRDAVIETARQLSPLGADVLKAEFPINPVEQPDETIWESACRELTSASATPWVLLSAGVSFEGFLRQTALACAAGASGVMAGRAIWAEATRLVGADRDKFLATIAVDRLGAIEQVVEAAALPWTELVEAKPVEELWYATY
jgi:tagatose 1,6-diphosphate aldolase